MSMWVVNLNFSNFSFRVFFFWIFHHIFDQWRRKVYFHKPLRNIFVIFFFVLEIFFFIYLLASTNIYLAISNFHLQWFALVSSNFFLILINVVGLFIIIFITLRYLYLVVKSSEKIYLIFMFTVTVEFLSEFIIFSYLIIFIFHIN